MTQFFKKFPVINYQGSPSVNLMARVNMSKLALNNKQAYYDYSMPEGTRPDNLSYDYYGNPDYVWLLGLTNKVIDPYYDFPISQEDVNQLIIKKYGSFSKAQEKILFFRNNWINDESNLSVSAYKALGVGQRKYWAPEINDNNTIVGYLRKKEDWVVTTNKVQSLTYTSVTGTFEPGELVAQNNVTFATVVMQTSTDVIVNHIAGTGVNGTLVGLTSGAQATVINVTQVAQNIPDDEEVYWTPITAFEYEQELNTKKKSIKVLDARFTAQASKELKNLMRS